MQDIGAGVDEDIDVGGGHLLPIPHPRLPAEAVDQVLACLLVTVSDDPETQVGSRCPLDQRLQAQRIGVERADEPCAQHPDFQLAHMASSTLPRASSAAPAAGQPINVFPWS